jgi:hypothetical protein
MDERGKRLGGNFRLPSCEAGEAGEHGVGLLEADVRHLGAVTGVPAERGPAEPPGLVDE